MLHDTSGIVLLVNAIFLSFDSALLRCGVFLLIDHIVDVQVTHRVLVHLSQIAEGTLPIIQRRAALQHQVLVCNVNFNLTLSCHALKLVVLQGTGLLLLLNVLLILGQNFINLV